MNLNYLALLALFVAGLAIWGGTVLSRRLRWPLILPALLFLGLAMGAFVLVWLLAGFYSQFNDDHAIPWIENLGIGLGFFTAASFIVCIYFFGAACVVAVYRKFHSDSRNNDT